MGTATRTTKKTLGLDWQSNNFTDASWLFCTFLCRCCTTTTWNRLVSRFIEDVNTRQQFSFSFSDLRYSPFRINFWKIPQHLTNWMKWGKINEVWKRSNSLLNWRFRCGCRCLSALLPAYRLLAANSFIVMSFDLNVSRDSEWLACSRWVVSLFQVFR